MVETLKYFYIVTLILCLHEIILMGIILNIHIFIVVRGIYIVLLFERTNCLDNSWPDKNVLEQSGTESVRSKITVSVGVSLLLLGWCIGGRGVLFVLGHDDCALKVVISFLLNCCLDVLVAINFTLFYNGRGCMILLLKLFVVKSSC